MPVATLVFWALLETFTVVGPAYPPTAVSGGVVVAVLRISSGAVADVAIMQGDAPFVQPAKTALAAWRFQPKENGDVLVALSFRTPQLYPVGPPSRRLDHRGDSGALPYPRAIVEPAYPPNSLGEGSVILRLEIDSSGSVSSVRTIQGLGDLTAPSIAAARTWKFETGRTGSGRVPKSYAYAVCVFRRPVITR